MHGRHVHQRLSCGRSIHSLATMGTIGFAAGNFLALVAAAALSVYAFDFIEPMWGYAGSFTVLAMLAAACSFGACVAFWLSSVLARRSLTGWAPVLLGTVVAASSALAFASATHFMLGRAGFVVGLAVLLIGSSLAPLGVRRHDG